jgi:hypothetical protein
MAQHDYVIDNQSGAAFRADLNNGLAAIVSQNSGTSQPSTTYAYQWWADTTTGLLKIRNAANNAWITVGTLASANLGLLPSAGTLIAALGDASTPGITFTGDLNTGVYSPGADQVAISTNGTGRLFIDSSGRALIGTSSAAGVDNENIPAILVSSASSAAAGRGVQCVHYGGTTASAASFIGLRRSRGTSADSYTSVQNGDTLGSYRFYGSDGSGWVLAAGIDAFVDGTSGANDMPGRLVFSTTSDNASSPTERMRIDSSGRVGIGTTPANQGAGNNHLQVHSGSSAAYFSVTNSTTGASADTNGFNIVQVGLDSYLLNRSNGALLLLTNGTERARIDSSGRLLVGTSSSLDSTSQIQNYVSSGQTRIFTRSDNLSNGNGCSFQALAYVNSANPRYAELAVYKHSGITNACGFLSLNCEDAAFNYLWVDNSDVLRISTNDAHIGTTSGTVVGAQTSDERIKNILGPVEYGLAEIKQLDPVSYALKSDPEQVPHLGFIAQQVNPIIPESVFDTDDHIEGEPEDAPTKLGMEYVALIPVLVNAIKELSAEVDALKAQLQAS